MVLVAVLVAAAVAVLIARPPGPARLLGLRSGATTALSARGSSPSRVGPGLACAVAGVALAFVVAAPVGPLVGIAVALAGPRWLGRLEPRAVRERRELLARDLPLALELLAACLAGGADPIRAVEVVSAAVGGPCGRRFADVGAALRAGSAPADAWLGLAESGLAESSPTGAPADPLASVARLLARTASGGAPVADTVQRLAGDARAVRRGDAQQAARRVGVLAVAPLGLCFLPAFVLIGVVPVIIGLAGPLLSGL
ncbi:MAG: type II secretion system F family protein [Mycobacteriales bacterium]